MKSNFLLTTGPDVVQAAITNENANELAPCGVVFTTPVVWGYVPLFRAYNSRTGGHFYTAYIDEYDDASNDGSHVGEGIACFCFLKPQPGAALTAVYRGYNPATDDHLYTTEPAEIYFQDGAYEFEGIVFYVYTRPEDGKPFRRLRDPAGLQHLYTTDDGEFTTLTDKAHNFHDEGVLGYVLSAVNFPADVAPLYEAYNPNDGSRFYTMDFMERTNATNNLGMKGSGITCYLFPDGYQPPGAIQLWRAYNLDTDAHFYSINKKEIDGLVNFLGFNPEGVTGWVLADPPTAPNSPPTAPLRCLTGQFLDNLLVPRPPLGLANTSNYFMSNVIAGLCRAIRGRYRDRNFGRRHL